MTNQKDHHASDIGEAINSENAVNEGRPRAMSAARAQESWEEFKNRSNKMAEAVMQEVTNPEALRTRARQAGRKARSFYRDYQTYILVGAAVLAVAGITAALVPTFRKKKGFLKI